MSFLGNEVLPVSARPSLLDQAFSVHGNQDVFTKGEVASARGSHPESPSFVAGSFQPSAHLYSLSLDTQKFGIK